jgi:hypothetical protein
MGRKTSVMIGDADHILEDDEFPSCRECGEPVIYFVHENAIGYSRTCTNHACKQGIVEYANKQVPGTKVDNCIKEDGIETLKEDINKLRELIDETIKPIMRETEPGSEEREERLKEEGLELKE